MLLQLDHGRQHHQMLSGRERVLQHADVSLCSNDGLSSMAMTPITCKTLTYSVQLRPTAFCCVSPTPPWPPPSEPSGSLPAEVRHSSVW